MICTDTACKLPAVHCEHLDIDTAKKVSDFIGSFITHCNGNGRLTLVISGGNVQEFEPTSRVPNKQQNKSA